jgi:hypothetical protein
MKCVFCILCTEKNEEFSRANTEPGIMTLRIVTIIYSFYCVVVRFRNFQKNPN